MIRGQRTDLLAQRKTLTSFLSTSRAFSNLLELPSPPRLLDPPPPEPETSALFSQDQIDTTLPLLL